MKQLLLILVTLTAFLFCAASCYRKNEPTPAQNNSGDITGQIKNKVKITIGTDVFTATMNDNATVNAFKAMLPVTIDMSELNANEKFFYFPSSLPTNAAPGGSIQAGDLMLYGNNCLVLFYASLNTSYSYTRLGKVDNTNGLKTALGAGKVTVKFELQ